MTDSPAGDGTTVSIAWTFTLLKKEASDHVEGCNQQNLVPFLRETWRSLKLAPKLCNQSSPLLMYGFYSQHCQLQQQYNY